MECIISGNSDFHSNNTSMELLFQGKFVYLHFNHMFSLWEQVFMAPRVGITFLPANN